MAGLRSALLFLVQSIVAGLAVAFIVDELPRVMPVMAISQMPRNPEKIGSGVVDRFGVGRL